MYVKFYQNIVLTDIDTLPSLSTIIYSRDDNLGHCINISMQSKLDNSSHYFVLRSFHWSLKEFQKLSQKWSESCHKYASHFTFFYSFTEKIIAGALQDKKIYFKQSAMLRPCTGGLFHTLFHNTFERHTVFHFSVPLWKPQECFSRSYRHWTIIAAGAL